MPTIELNDTLKELNFDYLDKEYPGENELVWCKRCQTEHRRGAPPEIEYGRIVRDHSNILCAEIDAAIIASLLKEHEFQT